MCEEKKRRTGAISVLSIHSGHPLNTVTSPIGQMLPPPPPMNCRTELKLGRQANDRAYKAVSVHAGRTDEMSRDRQRRQDDVSVFADTNAVMSPLLIQKREQEGTKTCRDCQLSVWRVQVCCC